MTTALALFIAANLLFPHGATATISSVLLWLYYTWPLHRQRRPADLVTALRLAMALAAFSFGFTITHFNFWSLGLFVAALALDGVDGWLARRSGPTAFGALFDMESDNAFLAALWLATLAGGRDQFSSAAALWLGAGLIIPCYRILVVALRRFGLRGEPEERDRWLWGLPREKVLFVAVAVLSLLTFGLCSFAALFTQPAFFAQVAKSLALGVTAGAVTCSTISFWPELFPAKV